MPKKYEFQFDFTGKTSELESSLKKLQTGFNGLKLPNNLGEGLDTSIKEAYEALEDFKRLTSQDVYGESDIKQVNKAYADLAKKIDNVTSEKKKISQAGNNRFLTDADLKNFKELQDLYKEAAKEERERISAEKKIAELKEKQLQLEKERRKLTGEDKAKKRLKAVDDELKQLQTQQNFLKNKKRS